MASEDVSPPKPWLSRGGSEEFLTGVITVDKTSQLDQRIKDANDSEQPMRISSFGDIYRCGSFEIPSSVPRENRASFMQWHSQGNLLMEMKREDLRMRHEANALFDGSSCSDSAGEGEFGGMHIGRNSGRDYEEAGPPLHDVFFTPDSTRQPVNNEVVAFLLKTFRTMEDAKLISAPFELTSHIETFRSRIFDVINKEFNSVNLSEALLTVAFNHYAGHEKPGYMTLDEYAGMMNVYRGMFSNDTMCKLIFDSMDRRRTSAISLNDFIAGMISCSPRAAHKANSSAGRLRLQHIFRAYDSKRKGYLQGTAVRVMLEHIHQLSLMANTEKVESISNMNSSFHQMQQSSGDSMDNTGSGRTLDESMEAIMANYENGFGYDAFYTCVNNGTIKDTHFLLRSNKDFAETIGQHLIHALSHVVVRTEVVLPNDAMPPDIVNRNASKMQNAFSASEMSPPKSWERSRRPSLWSTSNSPRSPEHSSPQNTSPYANIFAREDHPRQVQSARNRTVPSEPNVATSARDRHSMSSLDKKPLFQPSGNKGGVVDAPNYLAMSDHLFRKNAQYKGSVEHPNTEGEYNSRPHGDGRGPLFNAPLTGNRWSTSLGKENRHGMDTMEGGFHDLRGPEYVVPTNTPVMPSPSGPRGTYYSAPSLHHNSSDDEGIKHVRNELESRSAEKRSGRLETSIHKLSIRETGSGNVPSQFVSGEGNQISQSGQHNKDGSSINATLGVDRSSENNVEDGKVKATREGVSLAESHSADGDDEDEDDDEEVRFIDIGSGRLSHRGHMSDLESILAKRATDLCRRYRARFVGFNSKMLADNGVALKVFTQLYMRTFKCNDYHSAFERFPWCSFKDMVELCDVACAVLKQEPSLLKLQGTVQIHGPLNGSVFTLLESFNSLGWPVHGNSSEKPREKTANLSQYAKGEATKLLFLGDLIGEAESLSLETLMVLFSLKALFPYHVFVLRGRREAHRRDYKSVLFEEIHAKLTRSARFLRLANDDALLLQSAHELYHRIQDVFENMSVAACIEEQVLCLHGSLSKAFRTIDNLQIPKPIVMARTHMVGTRNASASAMDTHVMHALFGTFSPLVGQDVEDDVIYPQFTPEELAHFLRTAGISMLVTAGSTAEQGYNYLYGERVLQLGGCTPGGTYSPALLKERANMHYYLTHRSIQVP